MEDNKTKGFNPAKIFKFVKKHKTLCIAIFAGLVGAIIALTLAWNRQPEPVIVVKSSMTGFSDIDTLSVLEYSYNSYTTVYEKNKDGTDDKDKPKYHVAYDGTVKTGFDFSNIQITDDTDKKIIYIDIPEIQITSATIDEKSLDFIFAKEKYHTEDVVAKALTLCQEDLKEKVNGDDGINLRQIAKENAITTIKAITEPMIEHLPDGYKIEYR